MLGADLAESGAASCLRGLSEVLRTCIRCARDDANQVGPLELIQELNAICEDFEALWGAPADREMALTAAACIVDHLDAVGEAIEKRWFHQTSDQLTV